MIDRQLIHSRGVRVILALTVWGGMATFGLWQYRNAQIATEAQLARETEARELDAARSDGLEAIMADDHFGVITVNTALEVLDWNPGVVNLTGVAEADAKGHDVGAMVCGELTAKLQQAFAVRTASEESAKVLVENCALLGSGVEVRCRIYAARSKKTGEMLGVVLVDPRANVKVEP